MVEGRGGRKLMRGMRRRRAIRRGRGGRGREKGGGSTRKKQMKLERRAIKGKEGELEFDVR